MNPTDAALAASIIGIDVELVISTGRHVDDITVVTSDGRKFIVAGDTGDWAQTMGPQITDVRVLDLPVAVVDPEPTELAELKPLEQDDAPPALPPIEHEPPAPDWAPPGEPPSPSPEPEDPPAPELPPLEDGADSGERYAIEKVGDRAWVWRRVTSAGEVISTSEVFKRKRDVEAAAHELADPTGTPVVS